MKPFYEKSLYEGFGVIFLSIHTDDGILNSYNFSALMMSGFYLCALQTMSLWRAKIHCEERIRDEMKISHREEATQGAVHIHAWSVSNFLEKLNPCFFSFFKLAKNWIHVYLVFKLLKN